MYIIQNLHKYCKEHNLKTSNMCYVSQEKYKQHKGYKVEKYNEQ